MTKRTQRILFVCEANIIRSAMAEALFRAAFARNPALRDIQVGSAGISVWPGVDFVPAPGEACAVMKGRGIDLSGHRCRAINEKIVRETDLILAVEESVRSKLNEEYPSVRDRIFTLGEYSGLSGDITNPFGKASEAFEETARLIESMIPGVVGKLAQQR